MCTLLFYRFAYEKRPYTKVQGLFLFYITSREHLLSWILCIDIRL